MAQPKINPLTGLPMDVPLDPLTGLPLIEGRRAITPSTGMSLAAGDFSSFADYGVSPSPYFDMEEERARRQSTSEKWSRGLAKAGVTATGAFLEGTVGTVLGLGDWVASGFDDFDESMSRNAIGVMFDDINENMRESMPNYYTKEEQAMQGTLGGMWTANFWADKVANGAAYTLGTIASMAATGGYGTVGGALKLTGAAGKMSKALAGYRAAKTIKAGKTTMEGLRKGAQLHNNLGRVGKAAGGLEAGAMMSMAESAVEARETGRLVQEQLTEEMKKRKFAEQKVLDMENGRQTFESWEDVQLSIPELRQIELQAQEAEGAAFYGNMAVLMPTNLLMFGKMAAGFRSGVGFNTITKNTAKESAKEAAFKEFAETLPQGIKQTYKVGRAVKPLATNAVAEGFQEGMQYAISQGLSDYELRKFEDSGSGDLVEALLEGGSRRTLRESSPDILTRASKSWSDREAREQVIIGALVGILGGGRSAVKEYRGKKKNTQDVLNLLNSDTFYNLAAKGENLNFNAATVRRMMQAEQDGDVATFERLQSELITENVLHHIRMGSLDFFKERWNDAKNLSDEEFKALVGIDPEFEFTEDYNREKVVDGILKHADKVEEGYKMIEGLFNRQAVTGLPKLLMGKKGRQTQEEILKDNEIYKNFLIHNYARLESIDADVNSTLDLLEKLVPASKELRQRIQQYKRARFGDINIDSEGKEKVVMPDGNKLYKVIEELRERGSELEGPLRLMYESQLAKLEQLVKDRNTAALAFDNLIRDDKKRDLFISRTKAKVRAAEQAKKDAAALRAIDETTLPTDLAARYKTIKDDENVSDEAKEKIKAELKRREDDLAAEEQKFTYMKKSEVEAMQGLSPLQELARKNHLEGRTQEEPINVDPNQQAKKAKAEALARQREEAARKRAEARGQQPGPPTEPPVQEGPIDQGPPPPGQGQTLEGLVGQGSGAVMNTMTEGNGEFMLTEDGKVIIDDFGNPKPGPGQNSHTLDGEPIITHRNILQDPEVNTGTVVELRAVEDDWWLQNKIRPNYKGKEVEFTPIYIYIDGNAVGILQSGNTPMRAAVVEANGKTITTTIKSKEASNMVSAVTEDGKIFLSNAYEVFGDTPIGVVRFTKDSSNFKMLDYGNTKGKISEAELERLKEQVISRTEKLENLAYGQVVFFFKDPNGKWDFKVAHTAKLNDAEISKALELLQNAAEEDAYVQVTDLVGFNQLTLELFGLFSPKSGYLRLTSEFTKAGDRIIEIAAPSWLDTNNEGMVVAISTKNFKAMMAKRAAGETSNLIDAKELSKEDKNAFGGLVRIKEKDQDGNVEYKGRGFNMFKQHMDQAQRLLDEIPTLIEQELGKKRRQVDIGRLDTEKNYFQSLANEARPMTADEKLGLTGHEGVIAVDAINVGGGIMRDIGLTLSQAYSVDGKPVTVNQRPVTPITKPAPTQQGPQGPTAPPPGAKVITSLEELAAQQETQSTPTAPPPGAKIVTSREGLTDQSNKSAENKKSSSSRSIDDLANDADTPFRLGEGEVKGQLSEAQAKQWLKDRNIPVEFYDMAKQVGSATAHGYMKNAMVYLWKNAEVGTEYHEAFHFVFRMMLNDDQRAQLYKEAEAEYGKPTKEEIENAKRGQSGISDQAAYELALEEKMAEEFRDYVFTAQETAKTLPGKIRKFFQDLWNYIKSIFSNSVGVNQLFSLIEANNLPAKFERNFDRFKEDTAFRIVDSPFAKDPVRKQEVISTISNQFINSYMDLVGDETVSNEEVSYSVLQMLGTSSQNKGTLANYFLRHAFKDENNNKISDADFNVLKATIDRIQTLPAEEKAAARKELAETANKLGVSFGVPTESNELPPDTKNMSEQRLGTIAKVFYDVYINWYDVSDPRLGNVESYGWRDSVIEDLGKYGYTIKVGEEVMDAEIDNEVEDGNYNEDAEVNFDKIYNITHFENDPSKKISAEVKKLFGKMVNETPNSLGFLTFADIQETYKAAVHATVGLENFGEMVGAIQKAARYHKELVPIATYLATKVEANEAAMVRSLLGQDYAQHRFLLEEYNEDGTVVKIMDSDRRSASLAYMSQWRVEGKEVDLPREAALFKVNPDGTVSINNNAIDGKTRLTHINEAVRRYYETPGTDVVGRGDALNEMLWYMSMAFGSTKDISRARVIEYLQENPNDRNAFEGNVMFLLDRAFTLVRDAGRIDGIKLKEKPQNFFETEGSTIKQIADRAATYRLPTAMSFISGRGKSIYPYNTGSHFSHLVREVVEGRNSVLIGKMLEDESFNIYGREEYRALLLDMVESGKATIESFSLDTVKNEEEDLNQEYKEIGMRSSMILRMNAYLNSGNDYAYYPISVQETRGRMDFIKLPKFHNREAQKKAGIAQKSRQDIIVGIIVRDLVKLSQDPSLARNLGSGFHLSGIENVELSNGLPLSRMIDTALKNETSKIGKEVFATINEMAKKYLDTTFAKYVTEYSEQVDNFTIFPKDKDGKVIISKSRIDREGLKKFRSTKDFIESYLFDDLVAKVELANMLRGGATQAKDVTKFYKRMGLVNTPGTRLMLQGEYTANKDFGFFEKVIQGTINPVNLTDKEHDAIAKRLREEAERQGATKNEALALEKAYRIDNQLADRTDGQAFISPHMFRAIEQGLGRWTSQHEATWRKFLEDGSWGFAYTPNYKFYHEDLRSVDGQIKPEMNKNSYVVLTPDLVQGTDLLQQMYDRMMGQGKYSGMGVVHLINTTSATKGWASEPITVSADKADFSGLQTIEQDGSKFLMPQIINESDKVRTRMNRQIRKNIISAVDPDAEYYIGGKKMKGSEVLNEYHNLIESILVEENAKLFKRMGYDKMLANPNDVEARINFLKEIRNVILNNANKDGNVDSNMQKQLQLVEKDIVDFAVPAAFPAYQRRYQNLIFSLFKNNVHRIDVGGKELVQVASPGRFLLPKAGAEATTTEVKAGVKELFKSNPNLSKIGTAEQYSAYLNAIYPSGQILYHSTVVDFEEFDQSKATMSSKDMGNGLYLSDKNNLWGDYQEQNAGYISGTLALKYQREALKTLFNLSPSVVSTDTLGRFIRTYNISTNPDNLTADQLDIITNTRSAIDSYIKDLKSSGTRLDPNEAKEQIDAVVTQYLSDNYNLPGFESPKILKRAKVKPYFVNFENSKYYEDYYSEARLQADSIEELRESEKDLTVIVEGDQSEVRQAVVRNPAKNARLLGSKQDLEAFKKFVSDKSNMELRELRHIDVREEEDTIRHAEVLVSQDMLDKLGLRVGETGLAYRIPHQGYSSTVPIKIVGVLPKSFSKTIIVPGNITVQTGSDFDIDKLFVMLRDKADKGAGVEKRNRILDILEGITLSKNHFLDTVRPLTQNTLNELASRPEIYKEAMYSFDHPLTELLVESNAKASQTLVGTFANALSGFSVAVHGGDPNSSSGRGLRIHPQKIFNLTKGEKTYYLDMIQRVSKVTGRLANAGTTESLSAALDAFSNLIHLSLNENRHTSSAKVFLQHIGMDEETIIYFMNQPLVREFVKRSDDTGFGAFKVFSELGATLNIPKKTILAFRNNEVYEKEIMTQTHAELNYDELVRIVKEDDVTSDSARTGFINFIRAYYAGDELSKVYKAITPDTVDGMGDLAEIEAYLDNLSDLKMRGENSIVGYRRIKDILEGDSYPLARAYYNAIKESVRMSSELFLGGTPAVQNFKEIFKQAANKTRLDAKDHRFIDRMLFYHMLTKEGSPIGDFLSKADVQRLLLNRTESLYTRVQRAIKAVPSLGENTFLSKIAEPATANDGKARVNGIDIDNLEKMTPQLREETLTAFHDLLYNPQLYSDVAAEQEMVVKLGKALVLNAIVTTGLAPTYGSYFNSIPIEFFMGIEKDGVTLMDYFSAEFNKAKNDAEYFNDFVFDFVRNFGTRSIGDTPLVPRMPKNMFQSHDNKSWWTPKFAGLLEKYTPPLFVTFKDYGKPVDQVRLYQWNGSAYVEIQSMGINNKLIELNLRDSEGNISRTSAWTRNTDAPMVGKTKIKGSMKNITLNDRTGATSPQGKGAEILSKIVAVTTEETQKKNCE